MDFGKFSGKRICVAVSGGADSVVLLHYMKSLETAFDFSLCAVHCEHGIRGEESIADAKFVETLCRKYGVELFSFSADCPALAKERKESLETAARNFRYESFASLVKEGKTEFVATAHHRNDDAETIVFRLARGTLSGIKGIAEENGYLLRPLLSWTRKAIEEYAEKYALAYRTDSTNADLDIPRNRIRAEILPALEECVAGATKNIVRFSTLCGEDDELLYEYAEKLLFLENEGYRVALNDKKPLFRRACLLAMKRLGIEKDYTSAHLDDLFRLQSLERGAKLSLPQGIIAKKEGSGVLFYQKREERIEAKPQPQKYTEKGFDGGRYEVIIAKEPFAWQSEWKILRFDQAKLPQSAVFRFREEGDEIDSFGGRKTLKKLLNEKKIPVEERAFLPLLAEEKGIEVYAVCGVEISTKIKVAEKTDSVLYIAIRRKK